MDCIHDNNNLTLTKSMNLKDVKVMSSRLIGTSLGMLHLKIVLKKMQIFLMLGGGVVGGSDNICKIPYVFCIYFLKTSLINI